MSSIATLLLSMIARYLLTRYGSDEAKIVADTLGEIAASFQLGRSRLQAIDSKLERMRAEGRDPTEDEWAALRGERADLLKELNRRADLARRTP